MPDEQRGRLTIRFHRTCRGKQILHAAAEGAVAKLAFALAKASEVEAKHAKPMRGQCPGDSHGCKRILGAVREECERDRGRFRQIKPTGEPLALCTCEVEALSAHGPRMQVNAVWAIAAQMVFLRRRGAASESGLTTSSGWSVLNVV